MTTNMSQHDAFGIVSNSYLCGQISHMHALLALSHQVGPPDLIVFQLIQIFALREQKIAIDNHAIV